MTDSDPDRNLPSISDEELVFGRDGKVFADSREVAKRFGKRHKNVLQSIDQIIKDIGDRVGLNFEPYWYIAENNKKNPAFTMSRAGFMLLVMGFTGKKALLWKLRWIEAFDRMEAELFRSRRLPFHLRRYQANYQNVPAGHFSVLSAMTQSLIARLDIAGYELPERMWPDISEGMHFAKWIREKDGFDQQEVQRYTHVFEDGRAPVRAYAYPNKHWGDFIHHMEAIWIPKHAWRYFEERDPAALTYLSQACPSLVPPLKRRAIPAAHQLNLF